MKYELKKTKEIYELNQTPLTSTNERITILEKYFKDAAPPWIKQGRKNMSLWGEEDFGGEPKHQYW